MSAEHSTVKISVVIPYYQEAPGILARALKSIFDQQLDPGVMLDVIVVMEAVRLVLSVDRQTVVFAPFSVIDVFARKVLRRTGLQVAP